MLFHLRHLRLNIPWPSLHSLMLYLIDIRRKLRASSSRTLRAMPPWSFKLNCSTLFLCTFRIERLSEAIFHLSRLRHSLLVAKARLTGAMLAT